MRRIRFIDLLFSAVLPGRPPTANGLPSESNSEHCMANIQHRQMQTKNQDSISGFLIKRKLIHHH
jgi:hypothetical protein